MSAQRGAVGAHPGGGGDRAVQVAQDIRGIWVRISVVTIQLLLGVFVDLMRHVPVTSAGERRSSVQAPRVCNRRAGGEGGGVGRREITLMRARTLICGTH